MIYNLHFRSGLRTRRKSSKWQQVSQVYCFSVLILLISSCNCCIYSNSTLARLQPPEAAAERKPDQQESDITSQETSIQTPTPTRRNGSTTKIQPQAHCENSIHTITQSASRADLNRGSVAGSVRSPAVTILPKHRLEHISNRCLTQTYWVRESGFLFIGTQCRASTNL